MWYTIFKFELYYRVRRAETYIFFLCLFMFSLFGVDFVFQGVALGGIKLNAPLVIAKTMGAITGIFMILASMIMGVPVLRDYKYQIESLLFTAPIHKKDYLIGRFLGSFAVLLMVFSAVFFGMILSEFMPWKAAHTLLTFSIYSYLKPFLIIVIPILFFGAALFFVSGSLSKKLVVVYTQGIIFFVVFILTKAIANDTVQAILDPFSLTTLSLATDSWTIAEKSVQNIPLFGIILYNKLFWILLGVLTLTYGYKKFNFSVITNTGKKKPNVQVFDNPETHMNSDIPIPNITIKQDLKSKYFQLKNMSWFYFFSICKQPSFWAIVICGMIIILINSVSLGTVYGVDSYPATYFIVEELQETSIYFFIIILVFYSGELIWKERDANFNLIYDATPISNILNVLSKYIGLNLIYVVLMLALICSGILFQAINGYYKFELQVYAYGFFLELFPFLALYTCLSFFIQSHVNNKFVGILLVIVVFIANIAFGMLGFDYDLYFFGGNSLGMYSDMNGYGHFLNSYVLVKMYWLSFGMLLLIIAALLIVRGNETHIIKRLRTSKYRMSMSLLRLTGFVIIIFLTLGSVIFYNANILNEYWTDAEAIAYRLGYEKDLKTFEYLPQPKLVEVNLRVELYPSERNYTAEGYYILKNTTSELISNIHIQKRIEANISLDDVSFEGNATVDNQYETYGYTIHKLESALKPGDSIKMEFKQTFITKGFELGQSNPNISHNGTFFNNTHLPTIGYNRKYELQGDAERSEYSLLSRATKAAINDDYELKNARSGGDSDGIRFEMIIGTSKQQTALVPGDLLKQWQENDRSYFHYKSKIPIINFYAIVSADYQVKKDQWKSASLPSETTVDLEIYYHDDHDYNLERMMLSMKASLDYYTTHFSKYQYNHLRIMEFPRYEQFAQSFPGTIPFSESIGFVLDIDDEHDVDMAFYITAHEIAHQWFGMQVEAANVKGRHFILETLSQYAAMMVLKQTYSEEKLLQFLEFQKEVYTKGKDRDENEEPALTLVENQDYVYYAKGAIAMYEFQKLIGEEQVNKALRQFLSDWNTQNGTLKTKTHRYATSTDLLDCFRAVTPEHLQSQVSTLFETNQQLDDE